MDDYFVYLWTHSASGKKYVGKGRKYRATDHTRPSGTSFLSKAMKKHGIEAFELQYLAKGLSNEEALRLESFFIALWKTRAPLGYNFSDGGEGPSGAKHSEETKKKVSESAKERWARPGEKQRMSKALKNAWNTMDEETKAKVIAAPRTEQAKEKKRKSTQESWQDPEIAEKRSKGLKKAWETRSREISPETRAKMSESAKRRHARVAGGEN